MDYVTSWTSTRAAVGWRARTRAAARRPTVPYDKITDCDVEEPAGSEGCPCLLVKRTEYTFNVATANGPAFHSPTTWGLRGIKDFLSHRTLAARGRAKPDLLLKRTIELPDGVLFKVLEYKYGTAGVRVPSTIPVDNEDVLLEIMMARAAIATR
jgi:hypothetical protein